MHIATAPSPEAVAAMPAPVRVVVADDHPLFRRGLVFALERRADIEIVGEADNGLDALRLIDELEPDVALLDFRMPGLSGAEVCGALSARDDQPATSLLLLSAFEDPEVVWAAVTSGAAGYLGKTASHDEVADAVLAVACGGIAYTKDAAAGYADALDRHFGRTPAAS